MIRVLQVVNAVDRGGAETMVMNLYRHIDRSLIQFDFTNHNGRKAAYDDEIEQLGGRILYLPKFNGFNYLQYVHEWDNLFEEHPEYVIVHVHNYNISGIVNKIAKRHGVTVRITHAHSTKLNMPWYKKIVFNLLRHSMMSNSTHYFSCGVNAGKFLFGDKKFSVIPNAIETSKFIFSKSIRGQLRKELGISDTNTVYGHVGTFRTPKNHAFLIDVFKKIHEINPNAVLILIGSGELKTEIEEKVRIFGLIDCVKFLGQRSNVNEWLSVFDAFVMPSLWEGLPVSVVEAQCAGLPCFISDVIDKDVNLTGMVRFISLAKSADEWAKLLIELPKTDRYELGQIVDGSVYNINRATATISDFYLNTISRS